MVMPCLVPRVLKIPWTLAAWLYRFLLGIRFPSKEDHYGAAKTMLMIALWQYKAGDGWIRVSEFKNDRVVVFIT